MLLGVAQLPCAKLFGCYACGTVPQVTSGASLSFIDPKSGSQQQKRQAETTQTRKSANLEEGREEAPSALAMLLPLLAKVLMQSLFLIADTQHLQCHTSSIKKVNLRMSNGLHTYGAYAWQPFSPCLLQMQLLA